MDNIEFSDIQGLVFSGYGKMSHASYHPLKISQTATPRAWLKALMKANKVTHGADRKSDWCLNIAFAQNGLRALGVNDTDLNGSFEIAFVEGMNSERRQKLLQDDEASSPQTWEWGSQKKSVDLILMIYCKDEKTLADRNGEEQALYQQHGLSLVTDNLLTPAVLGELTPGDFRKEHFGFADGISQPIVEEFTTKIKAELDDGRRIAAGEFVLGYQNEYQLVTKIPAISSASTPLAVDEDFGKNGTYLVFRQLQQNVPAFWNYFKGQANDSAETEWLAAKCVGRWPSGVLINETHTEDPANPVTNNFDYAEEDPYGQGCPLGSHVRRSNPRAIGLGATPEISLKVVNRHRIIRRGRSYGEPIVDRYNDDKKQRGLFFLSINANIERQFEFIQHTWINNVKFNGLYDEKDPVIGSASKQADDNPMSMPGQPIRKRLHHVQRFVTTRGGAYFFLPGLQALRTLAGL
jgi:Dyp-type peroxidase family